MDGFPWGAKLAHRDNLYLTLTLMLDNILYINLIDLLDKEKRMVLSINGKRESLEASEPTVVELLKAKDVSMPDMVSVQLNGEILERSSFATTRVKEGDEVEFLYFMGGGR